MASEEPFEDVQAFEDTVTESSENWQQQVDYICQQIKTFAECDADFRAVVQKPKIGKLLRTLVLQNDGELRLTLTFDLEGEKENCADKSENSEGIIEEFFTSPGEQVQMTSSGGQTETEIPILVNFNNEHSYSVYSTSTEKNVAALVKVDQQQLSDSESTAQTMFITFEKKVVEPIKNSKKKHACEFCGKTFYKNSQLTIHRRTHTGDKPYECTVCAKKFADISVLKRHTLTHTGEKPFQCDMCDKTFAQSGHLTDHKRFHTGERPFVCIVCNKAFRNSSGLCKHKHIHTGLKPFKCVLCGKAFNDSGTLNKHKRSHTGEKPFKCDVCDKAFAQRGHLTDHKRTHSGEKPYPCPTCGKVFAALRTMYRHKLSHTGVKPFMCEVCGKTFTRSHSLTVHIRSNICA